jgi:ribonuclease Z
MDLYERMYIKKGSNFMVEIHELSSETALSTNEFLVESKEMMHDAPCLAYSFTIKEKNRLDKKKLKKIKVPDNSPLLGELVKGKTIDFEGKKIDGKKLIYKEPQRKITYIIDTKENDNTIKIAQDSDVLICESTYSAEEEEQAKEYSHLTSAQAANIAKKSKSKKLYLMHLSQRYENPKYILAEAKKVFKETKVAEDFDSVII